MLHQIRDGPIGLLLASQLPCLIEPFIFRFGDLSSDRGAHRATRSQHSSSQIGKLPVEQILCVQHDDKAAEVELVLEYVEKDRREPVQFADFRFAEIVLGDRDIGFANPSPCQAVSPMFAAVWSARVEMISAGVCEVTANTSLACVFW